MKKPMVIPWMLCMLILLTSCSENSTDNSSSTTSGKESSAVTANADKNAVSQAKNESSSSIVPFINLENLDNVKQGWGQGTQVDSDKRPTFCMQFQSKYGKYSAVFIGDNTKKNIPDF